MNASSNKGLYLALLAVILLSACRPTPAPAPATEAAPTVSPTATATVMAVPSPTPLPPTATAPPTPTPTATPHPIVQTPAVWPDSSAAGLHHARIQQLDSDQPVEGLLAAGDGSLYVVDRKGGINALAPDGSQESPDGQVYALGDQGFFLAAAEGGKDVGAHEFYAKGAAYAMQLLPDEVVLVQDDRLHFFNTDPAQQVEDPAPVPAPSDPDTARQEVEAFLLQHILTNGLYAPAGSYNVVDQPLWEKHPRQAALIILEAPTQQAWWYAGGELYQAEDPQLAIDTFKKGYVDGYPTETWIVYTFKVLSVDQTGSPVKAELSWHCGGTCGQGRALTLKRSQSGERWVVSDEMTWIS